jgi:hypothetical protein
MSAPGLGWFAQHEKTGPYSTSEARENVTTYLGAMTLSIMTLSIMTFSIMGQFTTLSIKG